MKKILVITDSINIEDSSGSKVNVALIKNLNKIGFDIKVLHYTRKEINLEGGIECIPIKEIKLSINYVLSRVQRIFQRKTKIDVSNFFESIFGFSFTFFNDVTSIRKSIRKNYDNEDLIITLSKGGSFRPHYAILNYKELHKKWLAYVHDPYPFHFYPRPYNWVEAGYKFKERFFKKVSESAKYSAFPSMLLKEWMGSYFPDFLNTGIVIPHQHLENKESKFSEFPDYFDVKKFNLLHAGSLLKQRSPEELIAAFEIFLNNNLEARSDSKLIFLGNADYHKNFLLSKENDNIYWSKGNVSYNEANTIQKNTSVNIILEAKSEISPFLPGKFPQCINSNKPILLLGPYYSESRRLLGHDYKYYSESNNVELISKHISELYSNWKFSKNKNENYSVLKQYFEKGNLKQKFSSIINDKI